jgi:hypothetical protein
MLFLGGRDFPTSREDLAAALHEALAGVFRLPEGQAVVTVAGERFPALDQLVIDLSDAHLQQGWFPPRRVRARQPGIAAAQFQLLGQPLRKDQAALRVDVSLSDARFDFGRDAEGRNVLYLVEGSSGRCVVHGSQADYQAFLLAQLQTVAAEHGATVETAELTLQDRGDRALGVELRVKASRNLLLFPLRMTVRGRGTLEIDDQLNARLCDLTAEGEGLLSDLVLGLVRDRLEQLNGSVIPLAAVSRGRLRLCDLRLRWDSGLEVVAVFDSEKGCRES